MEATDISAIDKQPKEWRTFKLEEIATFYKGKVLSKKDITDNGSVPCILYGELYTKYNEVINSVNSSTNMDKTELFLSNKNDILIPASGETAIDIATASCILLDGIGIGSDLNVIRTNENGIYLSYYINNIKKNDIARLAQGISVIHIYSSQLKLLKITLPSKEEQDRVANLIYTWDKAIEQTTNLIEQLKIRKKGLMQQLLTGKTRLAGFNGEWEEKKLGEFFKERKDTGFNNLPLLSIGRNGVYPQDEDKKDTSNADKSKYKRICSGDIGYNTMRMWQGRSALSEIEGIVSPAYTIVTPKAKTSSLFFSYLFKLEEMIHKFYRNSQGMVSDTWMCKFKDFSLVKFNAPTSLKEQEAIAEVLNKATKEIECLETYLDVLQKQKKGLMQQLLTGQKRVSVN